ncbi:hypothetical protein ZWY2020_043013 [Hordeum vulgare]|nr:hypothetical protein ZWY2020_043013 [Hordeum vulgare]
MVRPAGLLDPTMQRRPSFHRRWQQRPLWARLLLLLLLALADSPDTSSPPHFAAPPSPAFISEDKYRNMNVTVNASGSREKVRMMVMTTPTARKPRYAPKQESHSTAITTITSDGDDDVVDVKPIIKPIVTFTTGNKSLSRVGNAML